MILDDGTSYLCLLLELWRTFVFNKKWCSIADDYSEASRSLAALTGIGRTEWAQTRNRYFNSGVNKDSLDVLEQALFHVSKNFLPTSHIHQFWYFWGHRCNSTGVGYLAALFLSVGAGHCWIQIVDWTWQVHVTRWWQDSLVWQELQPAHIQGWQTGTKCWALVGWRAGYWTRRRTQSHWRVSFPTARDFLS